MRRETNRQSESGSALVAVLCLIFTAGLLATAALMLSKYNSYTISAHVELQKSFYINEGVANRVQYLIAADRSLYSTVELGRTDYSEYDHDRFFADGVVHHLNYYGTPVEFTITDARSGYDLSSSNYQNTLSTISNSELFDETLHDTIDNLVSALTDYMDSGDELSLNGFEAADYEDIGMSPLPRNAAPQFREEFAWVPGFLEMFPADKYGRLSSVRLVPPEGLSISTGSPSIFTADRLMLQTYCNLEEEEADEVLAALDVYRRERILLEDQLDELLVSRLGGLTWQESGTYTVTIGPQLTQLPDSVATADEDAGRNRVGQELPPRRPSYRRTFTFPGFNITGPQDNTVQYLEWMFH